MQLRTILFGDFTPPPVASTRTHKLGVKHYEPQPNPKESKVGNVIEAIRTHSGITSHEIARITGVGLGTVTNTLTRLIAARRVARIKDGNQYKYFGA